MIRWVATHLTLAVRRATDARLANVDSGSVPSTPINAARPLWLAAGVALWGAAIFGSLQLHTLDLPLGHGICGPWGCAAAPEALLGYHTLWLTLLAPPLVLAGRVLGPGAGRKLALVAIGLGAAGVLAMAGTAAVEWLRAGELASYAVQRGLFVVVTTPDLPLIPLLLAGLIARLARLGPESDQPQGSKPQSVSSGS